MFSYMMSKVRPYIIFQVKVRRCSCSIRAYTMGYIHIRVRVIPCTPPGSLSRRHIRAEEERRDTPES